MILTCAEYCELTAEFILRLNSLRVRPAFCDRSVGTGPCDFGKAEPIPDLPIMLPTASTLIE